MFEDVLYKCSDCGSSFVQPKRVEEMHGFTWGRGEVSYYCPCCGSSDFEEYAERDEFDEEEDEEEE